MTLTKTLLLVAAVPVAAILADGLFSNSSGKMPAQAGPNAYARGGQSCGGCHNPFSGGPSNSRIVINVAPAARVLTPGQRVAMAVTATGGAPRNSNLGWAGGFAADVSRGTLAAGSGSQVNSAGTAITHTDSFTAQRNWTFSYTAPNTTGPVDFWCVVNTVNGNGRNSGDFWAWNGSDDQNSFSTPVRMYVNHQSVTAVGTGCPDGNRNVGVLGIPEAPTLGNSKFTIEAVGLPPAQRALLIFGFQKTFAPISVAGMGAPGCFLNTDVSPVQLFLQTSGSNTKVNRQLGNGTVSLPTGMPNLASLKGLFFRLQLLVTDPDATNPFGVVFTNGVAMTIQ